MSLIRKSWDGLLQITFMCFENENLKTCTEASGHSPCECVRTCCPSVKQYMWKRDCPPCRSIRVYNPVFNLCGVYIRIYGQLYIIQLYVIQFVSDLWQIEGFLLVFRFPPPMKLTALILLNVALNPIFDLICISSIFTCYIRQQTHHLVQQEEHQNR